MISGSWSNSGYEPGAMTNVGAMPMANVKTTTSVRESKNLAAQVQHVGDRIVAEFKPEKIILFGSYAYGVPKRDSDLNLMVVMRFEGDQLEKAVAILKRLNMLLPIDLLVRTPEQIEQRLKIGDRFIREVVERGKVVYEATDA
jgi:uncharacterized protein